MPQSSEPASTSSTLPTSVYIAIFVAIATISSAAILIRLALTENMPAILITGSRLFIATVVLTPITLRRHISQIQNLTRTELILSAISGFFLAAHFMAWVTSLRYTTVLVSVVIVMSGPIWVAILEVIFLRIRLSNMVIFGLVVAILGGLLITIPFNSDMVLTEALDSEDGTAIGAFLAWLGALSLSIYMLIGRKLRAKLPVIPYIWLVYGMATMIMLIAIVITSTPVLGYRIEGYLILLAMGLFPQLFGHSSLNYLLEYLPATIVSMFTQLEPIGSAILAFIIFAEIPPNQQIIGSAIIIVGVLFASRGNVTQSE